MGENYSVGWGGGAPCTEVRARAVLVTRDGFDISSLRSSYYSVGWGGSASCTIQSHLEFRLGKPSQDALSRKSRPYKVGGGERVESREGRRIRWSRGLLECVKLHLVVFISDFTCSAGVGRGEKVEVTSQMQYWWMVNTVSRGFHAKKVL